jgi:dipeptidyl aminopeptidase/acylaminoacyl peptidase
MLKIIYRSLLFIAALAFAHNRPFAQTTKSESVSIENKKKIPASVFFSIPEKTMVTISPDGSYLAYLAPFKETLNLFVEPVNGGTPVRLSMQAGNPVEAYQWASEDMICFQAASGDFNTRSVYAAQIFTPESAKMISGESMDARLLEMNAVSSGPYHFMQKSTGPGGYDLCNFNFDQGIFTTVFSGQEFGIFQYFVGFDGGRMVALENIGKMNRLLYLESQWGGKKVLEYPAERTFIPVAFDSDNKTSLLVISNVNRKHNALVSIDYIKGVENKILLEQPGADVVRTHNNLGSTHVLEVELMGEKLQIKTVSSLYDPIRAEIVSKLEPKSSFVLDCVDRKENNFIIHTVGARIAPSYYRYNVPNKELKLISNTNRDLIPAYLSEISTTKFVNRQGTDVKASIVTPHSGSIQAPVVIYLPESPEMKVLPEFNPDIQFLANSGFIVWILDFAGNENYGQLLSDGNVAGWAQLLGEDLIDAAKHLIKQGMAHPDKVSILAQGLSGPIATHAMAAEPQLFNSAVYVNAVHDFNAFFKEPNALARDPHPMIALLKFNNSLAEYANLVNGGIQVKQPMLFVTSNYDECFPSQQSSDAAVVSAKSGNAPEILAVDDAHEIFRMDNKVIVWDGIVEFLRRQHSNKSTKTGGNERPIPDRNSMERK